MRTYMKTLRVVRGWTQAELGRRAGVKQTDVCAIERDRELPSDAVSLRIADALGCPVEALEVRRLEVDASREALTLRVLP